MLWKEEDLSLTNRIFSWSPNITHGLASIVHIVDYELNDPGFGFWHSGSGKIFSSFQKHPDQFWGPTQPLIQWVPAALYLGKSGPGMRLTTNLHLVLRLSAAIQTFPLCIHGTCKENFTLYPVLLHPGNQSQKWQNFLVRGR